jgi:hypothetical protein
MTAESHLTLEERIRRRAHQIWEGRKGAGGDAALDDWLAAEREVLGSGNQIAQDRGTTVGPAGAPAPAPAVAPAALSDPLKKPKDAQKRRSGAA